MKKTHPICFIVLATIALFTSCIQEEAPNAECDILAVKSSWLEGNKDILSGKPIISNTAVRFYVNEEVGIEALAQLDPQFELTPGAQIEKLDRIEENGDRGIYLYYHTTSEDGNWGKDYEVSFTKQTVIDTEATFSFECFGVEKTYNIWHEEDANGTRLNWWATANAGFLMSGLGKKPADFPTSVDSAGVKGCCVKLTTRSTGMFGKMMEMPIAPGNIFIGEFLTANATKAPLEATRFGLAIAPSRPVSLTGYYKYTPGEVFTNKVMEQIPGRIDTCAIYSVLYEIDPENFEPLNGGNVLSSDRIVLVAQLKNPGAESEWTGFEIPYQEFGGNMFDRKKLENGEYAITIVASSSKGGEVFEGAVGSTLHIDELKINWDNK
ncbi:MAG: PCMD domain-containing protein [Bacteroidaceae bacterium]|nr:PCMD domain-containing protein [Bacteroidaceae bacterium]